MNGARKEIAALLHTELHQLENSDLLVRFAALNWLAEVQFARKLGRSYFVALSGGRIAGRFLAESSRIAKNLNHSLAHVHFFWADERCVPPDHAESNYRVAHELLLGPLGISKDRIHRVRGELEPEQAAREAEAELRQTVPTREDGQPVLDLVLLGVGEDGHVASLFPGEPAEVVSNPAAYRAVIGPKPPPQRVTLGYGVLAAAGLIVVLISGGGKAAAMRESLELGSQTPLARVLRRNKVTRVLTDLKGRFWFPHQ
jgi:6-phosphogluconolactonase